MSKVIVTGGCGFVGHHFVEHVLKNTDWEVIVVDKLSYSSFGYDRLRDISVFNDKRVYTVNHDFVEPCPEGILAELQDASYFVHMAAETHVDHSIGNPMPFIRSNVIGTHNALMAALELDVKKFIYFSTDEVFGAAPEDIEYHEWDRYKSGNPYAASKAAGEELSIAYHNTYGVPAIVTHTMNIFGERQHPEKFIPMAIRKIRDGEELTIHANEDGTIAATRFWLHARNAADAVLFLLENGTIGDKYNIVGEVEMDVYTLANHIAAIMGIPLKHKMVDFHSTRPGHDMRYALNGDKMVRMGYQFPLHFMDSLERTVEWTLENEKWL